MATSSKVRYMKECPVCFEVYINPQKLECDHSLCESCVNRLDLNGVVKCPLCKRVCARTNVKLDFRLSEFIDVLNEQELDSKFTAESDLGQNNDEYTCQMCESFTLEHWCVDCELWICETCLNYHKKSKALKEHSFVSFKKKSGTSKKKL